jgi:hypothetical protein
MKWYEIVLLAAIAYTHLYQVSKVIGYPRLD